MQRRGTATLPLHGGSAPRWLFDRMVDLGDAIAAVIVDEYGPDELADRLSDPYWFQALGCVLGFDWHSSGLTTTTMGALKEALDPDRHGVIVAGGKGATSRNTPDELRETPLDVPGSHRDTLVRSSRLSATVDNACLQDSYTLYHHTLVATETGAWCVVQQGMNDETARRYHWHSDRVDSFVDTPQTAICAQSPRSRVLDLVADGSAETRAVSLDLVNDDPAHLKRYLRDPDQRGLEGFTAAPRTATTSAPPVPHLDLPRHHRLGLSDLSERSIDQLHAAYERQPADYEELVGLEGVGPASLRALALVAELVHDADPSREDPAKYAYAHGGKDGTPYPVDRERYDRSVDWLESIVAGADLERETRQTALSRLAELA